MKKLLIITLLMGHFALFSACTQTSEAKHGNDRLAVANDSIRRLFNQTDSAKLAFRIDTFFRALNQKYGFNGNVLISKFGHVIYRGAFGYKTITTRDTLTLSTPFQLASVSKQFTAVAIFQLIEKGLLRIDDPVYRFVPNFPYDSAITIRSLLTHRSGLPNYQYSLEKQYDHARPLSNREVVEKLIQYKPRPYYLANRKFNYNNTNYVLLAYLVEKLSGKPFRQYMDEQIFKPLGMNHTFIFDGTNTPQMMQAATGYTAGRRSLRLDYLDSVVGDKSIYSTVEDIQKWDEALYTEKLVKQSTLASAFVPAHNDRNLITKNYGMGWRLQLLPDGERLTFHTGWWHGFKNYYLHHRPDQSSIIILSNIANRYMAHLSRLQAIVFPEKAACFLKEPLEGQEEVGGGDKE
ncbi:MAG: serine hydrolase domain-containing protein [Spirosomataceae bacterium]